MFHLHQSSQTMIKIEKTIYTKKMIKTENIYSGLYPSSQSKKSPKVQGQKTNKLNQSNIISHSI